MGVILPCWGSLHQTRGDSIFFFGPQIRNALNPHGLTVVQSFLRIFRRLYPALITVVTVIVIAATVIYPPTRWIQTGKDAAASLLYVQNLHLAQAGQDYAAINRDVSLFQHIWSMSAQLQIYVGSLLVIAVLAAVVRWRWPWMAQRLGAGVLHWLLVVATVASFGYAVYLHGADQGWNYYSPVSRFWEIGLGGCSVCGCCGVRSVVCWISCGGRWVWPVCC
jgi:peptidoglycan/LPS O-acetylase OafA/YrhL